MHFEVPKATSFKEFGGEYLMIVISILTALALEHGAQSWHHRTVAREASENINAEIHANIAAIKRVIDHNKAEEKKIFVVRNALLADILHGTGDAELNARMDKQYKDAFRLAVRTPTLRREAWEVAVANQAVSWMAPEQLKRYSVVYASMRDNQTATATGNHFLDGPRMLDTMSDVQLGKSDPRAVFRMLNQMISSYDSLNGNLAELQKEMEQASQ